MTRLSCHWFRHNEAPLWLSAIAHNPGNLWRQALTAKPLRSYLAGWSHRHLNLLVGIRGQRYGLGGAR
jgi:hypothetical protein